MAGYVPDYRKKRQRVRDKEAQLRRLIAKGAAHERLLEAAEEVRAARVREVRARKAQVIPANAERAATLAHLDQPIDEIFAVPVETILEQTKRASRIATTDPRPPLFAGG